ncbi:MAG: glutamate-5-semialdehyde dehydrogenase [Candidatus Margulisbacteria bacterium]|nr:glutamate-5-semialdehyde dehydrogenase [Candidatus Margulisiibacteriota bacterium]
MKTIVSQCAEAKRAFRIQDLISSGEKNRILGKMADAILANQSEILSENQKDREAGITEGLTESLIDRLTLTPDRLQGISASIRHIAALADPIGQEMDQWTQPNGLEIQKVRVPLGVIGMIYEARPNVTADAIALTFKTGNAVVLRGSSSAYRSNLAITTVLRSVLETNKFNSDSVQLLEDTSREGVETFVRCRESLDLVIPRGSAAMIKHVVSLAMVPTIETGAGNCHIFVDASADLVRASEIIINAKTQRPSVCNSCEKILVHASIARKFLDVLLPKLREWGVRFKGDKEVCVWYSDIELSTEDEWYEEFLDLVLGVHIVGSVDEAIGWIQTYGSHHTDVILSQDKVSIDAFVKTVDSAVVGVNVSSRFTDGGEFGFGAEIGISTQKLHARGPMGLTELTSYKYVMRGDGLIR